MRAISYWLAAPLVMMASVSHAQSGAPVTLTEAAPPDTIIYETTSWGRVTYHLELHRDGRLLAWRHDSNGGPRREERDEQRGPAAYDQALAALTPLSPSAPLECSGAPTDGPSGHYLWHNSAGQQRFTIYYGCYSANPRPPGNQIAFDAEERFFALVAPPSGTAP